MGPGEYRREIKDRIKRYIRNCENYGYYNQSALKIYDCCTLLEEFVRYKQQHSIETNNLWFLNDSIEDKDTELFNSFVLRKGET